MQRPRVLRTIGITEADAFTELTSIILHGITAHEETDRADEPDGRTQNDSQNDVAEWEKRWTSTRPVGARRGRT